MCTAWDNNTVAMGNMGEEDETVTDGNKWLADINYNICVLSSASIVGLWEKKFNKYM